MEILHWLDDRSRLCLASTARTTFKAPDIDASYLRIAIITSGRLLRDFQLDPARDYRPQQKTPPAS